MTDAAPLRHVLPRNLTHCCECDRELLDGPVTNWDDYFVFIEEASFACGPCAEREGYDTAE